MTGALAGMSVLDASDTVAGQFCARLLADYGASVRLAEPPEGSPVRRMGAIAADGRSYLFRHLNAGKVPLPLDPDVDTALAGAAAAAEVIIVGSARRRDVCRAANPAAIVATVTGFGTDGPLAGWRGLEMIYQSLSGIMPNNGLAGRPPLYGCGERASFAAGLATCCGILAADLDRLRTGRGQSVDVAIAEVAAMMGTGPVAYSYSGTVPQRRSHEQSMIRCGGEWVLIWCYPYQWADFCAALGATDLMADPRFEEHNTRARNWPALLAILQQRLADVPAADVVARLRARRLITASARRPSHLPDDPHLAARGFWSTDADGAPALGRPFRITPGADVSVASPSTPTGPGSAPLTGLRILDLTTAWAGPMAGRILGFLGADVIHFEHASRPDLWRHHRQVYNTSLYAGSDADGPRHNRNALFNSQNINKRSLTLDLKAPAGAAIARQLALSSDVILTNFTPGTLDRLGLGHAALAGENPGLVVCEMPAFGLSGPDSGALAVGATMEMAAGMASLIGYRDGPPTTTGPNYPDPIGGFNAATAILVALAGRARTGRGAHVEVPQVEAAMQFIGAEILEACETGRDPERDGNRSRFHAPHDVYPASGPDTWVAISAPDEDAWRGLCAVVGPALADDPSFATPALRLANRDALDAAIAQWTGQRDKHDTAALLQAAGVAAAPVLDAGEVAAHPFFRHRRSFVTLPHPDAGERLYQTVPIHLAPAPGRDLWAGPCIGQHTDEILAALGLSTDAREDLARTGVTAHTPT